MAEQSSPAAGVGVSKARIDPAPGDGSVHPFANDPAGCVAVRDRLLFALGFLCFGVPAPARASYCVGVRGGSGQDSSRMWSG